MTLVIETPTARAPERDYILDVLLGDFLGLDWRRQPADRSDIRITQSGQPGEIRVPDVLLSVTEADWLTDASMPSCPLPQWDTIELSDDINLVDATVPVLYGSSTLKLERNGSAIILPIDIFGSAFFMLSRYEEMVTPDRDEHDRFPAWASVAYQEGFLERPIVDEYVEVLWAAMQQLWPQLKRKQHAFQMRVSCDVDSAIRFRGGWKKVIRGLGGDILKRRSPTVAARNVRAAIRAQQGDLGSDPHWHGLQWIMDINEQAGNKVAFYFIPEITDAQKDDPVSLADPRMRAMLREMHERGHEIGLHPGYNTYKYPDAMARAAEGLKRVMQEEGISQPIIGGRQHYLRWQTPATARQWADNGLDYDSTLSYADRPGFRCGTCREYPLFDAAKHEVLDLRERPLIVMECTVIADRYLGLGYSGDALSCMTHYKRICQQFHGDFGLLWHNSHFAMRDDKRLYRSLLSVSK